MTEVKKKARPAGEAAEQAKVGTDFWGLDSHDNCTLEASEKQALFAGGNILDLIPVGAENAVSRRDLCAITGLEDRALRQLVHRERKAGHQILTNMESGGYYRPEHSLDTVRFIKSMRRRAAETLAVADAVECSLMNEVGQSRLDGV